MTAKYPIPPAWVQAFREAIQAFVDWRGEPEPRELLFAGQSFTIGAIADMASLFKDEMPQDIYDRLLKVGGFGTVLNDRTFVTGGRFLRHLYDRRKARYEARGN